MTSFNLFNPENIIQHFLVIQPMLRIYLLISIGFILGVFIIFLIFLKKLKESRVKYNNLENKLKKTQDLLNEKQEEAIKQNQKIKQIESDDKEKNWYNTGMIQLGNYITKNKNNLLEFSSGFLSELISYIDAQQGALYILNDEDGQNKFLELIAGYGLPKTKNEKNKIEVGESLIGVCFKDREIMNIEDIPENYTMIESGIGKAKPKNIIILPLIMDDLVLGVIEIAAIQKIEPNKANFIEKICEIYTSGLFAFRSNQKMARLLENSNKQAEELKMREEEMRQNMEEMQATQEEAERRERDLLDLNVKMEEREREFKRQVKEKERAFNKAHEIIERQEKMIEEMKQARSIEKGNTRPNISK